MPEDTSINHSFDSWNSALERSKALEEDRGMGSLVSRKSALLFIVIVCASLFSTSFAGIPRKFMCDPASRIVASTKEMPRMFFHRGGETRAIERVLRVKTNDYGRYDATPTLVKPPFKLIPN